MTGHRGALFTGRGTRSASRPGLSVLIPSVDRPDDLGDLLATLAASRDVPADAFEVRIAWHARTARGRDAYRHLLAQPPRPVSAHGLPAADGASVFRNALALGARGDLFLFLDDDLLVHPRLVAETLRHAKASRDDLWGGRALTRPRRHRIGCLARAMARLDTTWRSPVTGGDGKVVYIPGLQFAIRRAAFEALGGFDPALAVAEDSELCLRAAAAGFTLGANPAQFVVHRLDATAPSYLARFFRYGLGNGRLDRRGVTPPVRKAAALARLAATLDPRDPAAAALDAARLLAYWLGRAVGRFR